jgi:fibronectin-binding autotransporter adhesin
MDAGTVYRMAIPLTHAAALGETADGGVRVIEGSGVLALATANTFTGPVVIDGGTIRAEVAGAIPATATVEVNAGGVLDLGGLTVTVANVCGNGGIISNGTLRVTGEVAPGTTVTFDNLVFADGATLTLPLEHSGDVYAAGSLSANGIVSAEGTLKLAFSGEAAAGTLPKDFSVKIATLPAGSRFPHVVAADGLVFAANRSLELDYRAGTSETVEVWAIAKPNGFLLIFR